MSFEVVSKTQYVTCQRNLTGVKPNYTHNISLVFIYFNYLLYNTMTQRIINDSFWTDPYIEDLDPSEKLVFLYLLSNPLCNIAGAYEIKIKRIAYETWFDKDMVEKILIRFEKDGRIMMEKNWIILVNFAKNQANNPNVIKGMQRIVDSIPEGIIKALKGFETLPYFTLLNLTLPNFTKLNSTDQETWSDIIETSTDIIIEKTPEEIIKEKTVKFIELTKVINRSVIIKNHGLSDQEIDDLWQRFIEYWTEPNKTMTKIKYDYEKTFEVTRRFWTFIKNKKDWSKKWSSKQNYDQHENIESAF